MDNSVSILPLIPVTVLVLWSPYIPVQWQAQAATLTFVQSNIRRGSLYFHWYLCTISNWRLGQTSACSQHIYRSSLWMILCVMYCFLFYLKVVFWWLQKFGFSWCFVVFHLAVSNVGFVGGAFFPLCDSVPLKAVLYRPVATKLQICLLFTCPMEAIATRDWQCFWCCLEAV